MSGPIDIAKQVLREKCLLIGLCVTIEPTLYIYTGGEETGFVIGLINYPRFPAKPEDIWEKAQILASALLIRTAQQSVLVMDSNQAEWTTTRST